MMVVGTGKDYGAKVNLKELSYTAIDVDPVVSLDFQA
jgi:hypothetical protein